MQEKKEDLTKTQKTEVLASSGASLLLGDLKDAGRPEDPRKDTDLGRLFRSLGPKNRLLITRVP